MAHLVEDSSQDGYYFLGSGDNLKEVDWTNNKGDRKLIFSKKLFIDHQHKIINTSDPTADHIWNSKADEYEKQENSGERIPDLPSTFTNESRARYNGGGTVRVNQLRVRCIKYLTENFDSEEAFKLAQTRFIRWCTQKQ